MLTQERLKQLLSYDPEMGVFTWNISKGSRAQVGSTAGCIGARYSTIGIDGRNYMIHVLAWLYTTGSFPENEIDHINGDGFDNRWINLRSATRKENMENTSLFSSNSSGYRGVTWYEKNMKWGAIACHNGKRYFAGLFETKEQAAVAAKHLRDKLFTHHHTSHSA
jgi:hypothetical protein